MESIKIKTELKIKSEQRVVLTLALREALSILEMPLPDLAEWIQKQIEQNPALQFSDEELSEEWVEEIPKGFEVLEKLDSTFSTAVFPESSSDEPSWIEQIASAPITLHEHLLKQAREILTTPDDLEQIEQLIGNLDEKGFIDSDSVDPYLLKLVQSFDPPGIAAQNLQHSLLLQLSRKGLQDSIAYRLIQNHYEDLMYGRKEAFASLCSPEKLQLLIDTHLSSLSFDPAAPFRSRFIPTQIPDVFIEPSDSGWSITHNDSFLPQFKLNISSGLSHFESSARWVEKMISRRCEIITKIVEIVLETQALFFLGKTSDLQSLSFKQVAKKLSLHESTISRAVKEKYISSPRGIFPLRYFFPHAASDTISHHTAKERLKQLIERENKQKPLSDQALTKALHTQGIPCARRTITKYRQSLKIPPASQRKQ